MTMIKINIPGVGEMLIELSRQLQVHIVTAGTFGAVENEIQNIPCSLIIMSGADQTGQKARYVEELGVKNTACIGNGRNDRSMLACAALGILVVQEEGAAVASLLAADVLCRDIAEALQLLLHPLRLTATLRT
jgi:soluble P-type ATPase